MSHSSDFLQIATGAATYDEVLEITHDVKADAFLESGVLSPLWHAKGSQIAAVGPDAPQYRSYINSPPCSGFPTSLRARRSTT